MGRTDPVLFITHLLGMPLHSGQVKYLRAVQSKQFRIFVLVPANRYGKSTMIACLQIWYLFYKHGLPPGNSDAWLKAEYRTANIAPHSALTEPVFKAIDQILTSKFAVKLPDGRIRSNNCHLEWFYLKDRTLNTPPFKQYFANNSYIEHRSLGEDKGGSLQGKPYGIITYDEGGRSLHLQEEVRGNILPRLADWIGPFHILSTPDQNSPSILFHHELYKDGLVGMNQTYTQEGSLRENLLLGEEQIAEQYKLYKDDPLGPQVLEGKFIFGGDNLFDIQSIETAQDEVLDDGERVVEGANYVVGIDSAIGSDEMVYSIVKAPVEPSQEDPMRLVRQMAAKGNSKSPQLHLNDLIDLLYSYKKETTRMQVILETWNGESVRFYHDLPDDIKEITVCYGSWQPEMRRSDNQNKARATTQGVKKADILVALRKALSAGILKIPKRDHNLPFKGSDLAQQLAIYKEDDNNIPTDRVISLALAVWLATENTFQDDLQYIEW